MKKGVLLLNLGSPEALSVPAIREYLDEFLMDERVIDLPYWSRRLLVSYMLGPKKRPQVKIEEYGRIWSEEGSPLLVTSRHVQEKVQKSFDFPIDLAMMYAKPDIDSALGRLEQAGVTELYVMPLYPHYAMSSFETVVVKTMGLIKERGSKFNVSLLQPFYADDDYITALVEASKPSLEQDYDHLLFTFHGIPERHLRKSDPSHEHCMVTKDCCATCHPAHSTCYRHQCLRTAYEFVRKAGIPEEKYSIAFQSRLGKDPWLEPYTDQVLEAYGKRGYKKLLMISPAFVTDCLETLEEIGMGGKEEYQAAGGKDFELIPCLNEHPAWIDFLEGRIRKWSDGDRGISQLGKLANMRT